MRRLHIVCNMKELYKLSKGEALSACEASEAGLSGEEAERRLTLHGENKLKEGKKKSIPALFFAQFKDLMTMILICAAVLSGVLAYVTRDMSEIADTAILLFIILLNAIVGFIQQFRADSAIEKLKKLSSATARVIRDGKVIEIDASRLVVGDIIELEEGDRVPADCRVLYSENFRCDESALTGESKPVRKRDCIVSKPTLAERENEAHLGTFCVAGHARCLVTGTGMDTEMGAIAKLLHESQPAPSPLDRTISKLGKIISATVLTVAGILFLGGILARRVGFLENVMSAVAVAVAAIPEGMGAVVTIILAMGVQRMSRARAVMRRLSAVETLGSCSCICSDKTGTLTKNKMTVEGIRTVFTSSEEERFTGTNAQRELLRCIRFCHTVKGEKGSYVGDPTEIALVEYADRCGFFEDGVTLSSEPFSSERKMMSVAVRTGGQSALFVKGAAEVILKKCAFYRDGEKLLPFGQSEKKKVLEEINNFSQKAMRVLAFAEGSFEGSIREEGLIFLGLAAMYDPPKEGAKEAVEACRRAGIRTVMITGDSVGTAFEIAKRLGIAKTRGEVATGEQIDEMGADFEKHVREFTVFARVSPKHKLEIVRALQRNGEVVAMTGDGVNDAPSVRAADIGVAMGTGTDVTKNAADMVITDDDFSTMVGAVEEGRNVFFNVKKTISFFLSTNLAEVLAVLFVTLFLWKYDFLTSTQLLWINLITDSLPVLALGVERTTDSMNRPPVSIEELFSKKSLKRYLFFGLTQTLLVVLLFVFGLRAWGNGPASTCAFLTLSLLELFHAFNVREEEKPTPFKEFFSNKTLLITIALGILLNAVLVLVPFLRVAFDLSPLTGPQWVAVMCCSFIIVPIGELYKAISSRPRKEREKFSIGRTDSPAPDSRR